MCQLYSHKIKIEYSEKRNLEKKNNILVNTTSSVSKSHINFFNQIKNNFEHNFKFSFDLKKLLENPVSVNIGVCCPQGLASFQQSYAEYSL